VNGYCSLPALKAEVNITASGKDSRLERVIEAVSRQIDRHCNRHFYKTEASTARYYTADMCDKLYIDDLETFVSLAIDESGDFSFETTWARDVDFALGPYNAGTITPVRPFTFVEVMEAGGRTFPVGIRRGVKITGTWGWGAVPDEVEEACLIQSQRIFRRHEAAFGIAPVPVMDGGGGVQLRERLDPDVALMLKDLRRVNVAVG
jgi:hypothetical protein